ncbi:hypothetical protein OF83DRAFT_1177620 [Amylostereum chailletii]|nr:hypothetical protein OF83DRAFT_1177620 [Amylostereum chailletii]
MSKRAIYARINGAEYALCTPLGITNPDTNIEESGYSDTMVKLLFEGEMRTLKQLGAFKKDFEVFAEENGVKLADWRVNDEQAILGQFVDMKALPGDVPLHSEMFLATRLLDCRSDAPREKKFTGTDELGPADDLLSQTIHAFLHFTMRASKGSLVFCDIQAMHNRDMIWTVFNPQCHTVPSYPDLYHQWNQGVNGYDKIATAHKAVCAENPICQALALATLDVEDMSEEEYEET